jgi:hypothetical protein
VRQEGRGPSDRRGRGSQARSFLIDGEMVVADARGVASFDLLRGRAREAQAFVWALTCLRLSLSQGPGQNAPVGSVSAVLRDGESVFAGLRSDLINSESDSLAYSLRRALISVTGRVASVPSGHSVTMGEG